DLASGSVPAASPRHSPTGPGPALPIDTEATSAAAASSASPTSTSQGRRTRVTNTERPRRRRGGRQRTRNGASAAGWPLRDPVKESAREAVRGGHERLDRRGRLSRQ